MSGESTLPGVADQLITRFTVSAGEAWVVTDGMGLTDSTAQQVIQVGYLDTDEDTFADGSARQEGAGGRRDREQYDVHCAIIVVNGDGDAGDPAQARRDAFAMLAQLRRLLITTQPGALDLGVMAASVTNWAYRPDKIEGGARAMIRFDISIDGYTAL